MNTIHHHTADQVNNEWTDGWDISYPCVCVCVCVCVCGNPPRARATRLYNVWKAKHMVHDFNELLANIFDVGCSRYALHASSSYYTLL